VAAFYAVMVPVRLVQYDTLWFVHIGAAFLNASHSSPAIDSVKTPQSRYGYDGQFYFMIAADPANAHHYMGYGSDGGQAGRRYARIGYPMVARALSLGSVRAVPYSMLAINLAALLGAVWVLALWLLRRGRSPWFAALYGLWPGMVFAVFRDLSEPLAYFLAALAVLVFDVRSNRRVAAAAALLAVSMLTRETTIAFAFALALALAIADRRWLRPLAFLAGALLPMVAWRVIVTQWLHATTIDHTGGSKVLLPFYGMWSWHPWDANHSLIYWTVDVPFILAGLGALYLLWRRTSIVWAVLVLLNVALFVVFIPHVVTIDYGAAGRAAAPALIACLYAVPAVRSRLVLGAGAFLLSPVWFVLMAYVLGTQSPLDLTTL
jgi:hypothetical protein